MFSILEQEICTYFLNSKNMDKTNISSLTEGILLQALQLSSAMLSKLPKLSPLNSYPIPPLQPYWLANVHEWCKTQIQSLSSAYKKLSPSHCLPDFSIILGCSLLPADWQTVPYQFLRHFTCLKVLKHYKKMVTPSVP